MKNKVLLTIVMLFASYTVASEPKSDITALPVELYEEIITQSNDPYEAAHNFLKLRAASKTIQEKLDPSTESVIAKIAQKFNVDPLIPAFYIGTPAAKAFYKKRMQEQKKKLADDSFKKYLSDVMEQVLIRYNESTAFEQLIKDLLKNRAYFRVKSAIKVKENIWLWGRSKVFQEGIELRRLPETRRPVTEKIPVLNVITQNFKNEYQEYEIKKPNTYYQRIGKTIISLSSDYFGGKGYFAIIRLNQNVEQIGESLLFTIPMQERFSSRVNTKREFDTIGFYPQSNVKGYVIAIKSYSGLPTNPKYQLLELFFIDEKGSLIKKILSEPVKGNIAKYLGIDDAMQHENEFNVPLFE